MADGPDDDEVGYKSPPKHSQFKPGISGNPRGRPKGSRGFKTELAEALNARVRVVENGRRRSITTVAATLRRLVERAVTKGDLRAIERLLTYAQQLEREPIASAAPLEDEDHQLIAAALARLDERP
jgi:hypothetical protein